MSEVGVAQTRALLLYRFLWILAGAGIVLALMLIADLLLHLPGLRDIDPLIAGRNVAWTLVTCPLTIATGLYISRRIKNNMVIPALILWGVMNAVWTLRTDTDVAIQAMLVVFLLGIGLPAFFLLVIYFPTGQINPPWVNKIVFGYLLLNLLMSALFLMSHATTTESTLIRLTRPHPFYVSQLAPLAGITSFWVDRLFMIQWFVLPVPIALRYWRSGWHERQQLKWLLWLVVIAVPIFAMLLALDGALRSASMARSAPVQALFILAFTYMQLVPTIAIVIAVWRHSLWDIDVIIRRTLVYAVLTGIIAVIYFGGIVLAQQVFRSITGQSSDLAIVISTLLIAALFTPIRRRVQEVIDRRLYRRKYDAEKTLAQFNQTLRDEVNIENLKISLLGVVDETLQPVRASLWIRDTTSVTNQEKVA